MLKVIKKEMYNYKNHDRKKYPLKFVVKDYVVLAISWHVNDNIECNRNKLISHI